MPTKELTTQQIINLLEKYAPKREQYNSNEEFEHALVPFSVAAALSERVDVMERVVDLFARKVGGIEAFLKGLGEEDGQAQETASTSTPDPASTEAASESGAGAPDDKTPFPAGLKFRAEGPPVAGGTQIAVVEDLAGNMPTPDTIGRVVSVAPIPPSAPASTIVPPGAQPAPANGKR